MTKNLFTLILLCGTFSAYSQSSVGLIAHWDMNAEVNDVSGNGHNGTATNLTPAADINGVMGNAYYFNGVNSMITAPYTPDLNLSQYTICAIVKVMGFYSGTCQGNAIITRGKAPAGATGDYALMFDDNAYDDNDCLAIDSTEDVFYGIAGPLGVSPITGRYYTPTIIKNTWYKVVVTFNDTAYNTYVNDTLRNTATITTPGVSMGTSADSLSIGYDLFEVATGYPYPFKGVIDDILLYNRVLNDSEIAHYGDTCGHITVQPANASVSSGGTATYTVHTSVVSAAYQWQQDAGTGFITLSNSGPYSGVTTPTLTITGASSAIDNYHYRCLISNSWGCADTTSSALLTLGINSLSANDVVYLYPNPAHNELTITGKMIANVTITNLIGQPLYTQQYNSQQVQVDVSALPAGMYLVKINGSEVRKFVKE